MPRLQVHARLGGLLIIMLVWSRQSSRATRDEVLQDSRKSAERRGKASRKLSFRQILAIIVLSANGAKGS